MRDHVIMERAEAAATIPGTRRFVCFSCRFNTDDLKDAAGHWEWVQKWRQEHPKEQR